MNLEVNPIDENSFDKIAHLLMNKSVLSINGKKFRILEIEFYLHSKNHDDSYTHCHDDQTKKNTFYFHKFKNGTYKAGTFKGMDIILGNREENIHFGILIRTIQSLDTETKLIVCGPCNVVNLILSLYKCHTIGEFTEYKSLNIYKNSKQFKLAKYKHDKEKLYAGPRVGLSDKYPDYKNKNYRFVIRKSLVKKMKKSLKLIE
jgi:hypothetical protein